MIAAELGRLFDDPPRDFGPTPLWWWSGGKVTRERLEWQLRRFADGGIYNLVVINLAPAGPTFGAMADDPAWFSEEWWDRFEYACRIARELDLKIWFYDQIGFSGANIQGRITLDHPEVTGQSLRRSEVIAASGRVPLRGAETLLACYDHAGRRVDTAATGAVAAPDGAALTAITVVPTAFDYLNPAAVELLIDTVHGEFERRLPDYLGTVIPGSFQDELPATNAWSATFAEEFEQRTGYDLRDHLDSLFRSGPDGEATAASKIRSDYYAVRSALTEEALFRPLGEWHTKRGLLLGADQSHPARAGFPTQSTQLYTDYFRTHRWFNAAGSDHDGDSKVHSSMAHLYGHDRVWLEAFHSSGWGGTLEDTYDWLLPFLRSGATLYDPHASYFDTAAGWFEWAPPSTDWRQPYWKQYRSFAEAVSRICSIMTWGDYDADVAVLHPTTTAQATVPIDLPVQHFGDGLLGDPHAAADRAQQTYLALCGVNNWRHWQGGLLDAAGIAFDVIDDASIQVADLDEGRLSVRTQRYRTVILPQTTVLETATAEALADLLDTGGRVITIGEPPTTAAGLGGEDLVVRRLAEHPRLIKVADAAAAVAGLDPAEQHVAGDLPLLVRRSGSTGVALITGVHPNASQQPDGPTGRWTDDFDRSRYASRRQLRIRAEVAEAEVWDPAGGERRPVLITAAGDGTTMIDIDQQGAPALLLVWREGAAEPTGSAPSGSAPAEAEPAATGGTADLSDGWTGTLVPTLDNSWGDLARPAGRELDQLELWHVEAADGDGPWQPSRSGYGQRVMINTGPAPEPLTVAQCDQIAAGAGELAGPGWQPYVFSASRGVERDPVSPLGGKGLVPAEFVQAPNPEPGEQTTVRAVLRLDHRGPADLVVTASAAKRVSWNGVPLAAPDHYAAVHRVPVDREINILEYALTETRTAGRRSEAGSGFTLVPPDGYGPRPEYMAFGDTGASGEPAISDGLITFSTTISLAEAATTAALVVGAAGSATVLIDGTVVGRQEKVEYYDWGARPMYFRHDVTGLLGAGDHVLAVRLESSDITDLIFVDLVAHTEAGPVVAVSGPGWTCTTAGQSAPSAVRPEQWNAIETMHAGHRPHPLRRASWLRGEAEVGVPSLDFDTADSAAARPRRLRTRVPSGTARLRVPLRVPAEITIDGSAQTPDPDGWITLADPPAAPAWLELITEPVAFLPGASVLDGPIEVEHRSAPITLGDWRGLGLGDYSGGLSYRRTLEAGDRPRTLDLGDLRGSVDVLLDGEPVGSAFCAPFRFTLPPTERPAELEIVVYNTLGPYLHAATSTTWVFPTQLSSGLYGPVTIDRT
ncbi:hypothetical protein [Microlunatus speluncae]|uniref:hypothetical protein n=1 Tax=Microlunatus speluncae TaxID=2594267 RepID=UPI0012663917|nr:hypothetical protein [Microlunatus speluncae]